MMTKTHLKGVLPDLAWVLVVTPELALKKTHLMG
jgi:hypothetical protein